MSCPFCAPLEGLLQPPLAKTEVEIIVRLPADTPLINWGIAMDKLTESLGGGEWWYRMPPGQAGHYEIKVRS